MLTIINRWRPISIDAFTYVESVYKLYPPRLSRDYIPQWWRNLPTDFDDPGFGAVKNPTMKRCTGFIEAFRTGFMVPMWTDLALELFNEPPGRTSFRYRFADGEGVIQTHMHQQYTGFVDTNRQQHLKIIVPWRIREPTGVNFTVTQPVWNMGELNRDITILGGVTDFKYQDSAHFQLLVNYPEVGTKNSILIPADMPLMQVIPVSDRPIKIHTHLVERSKYVDAGIGIFKFTGNYLHRKRMIDRAEKSQCPFKTFLKK